MTNTTFIDTLATTADEDGEHYIVPTNRLPELDAVTETDISGIDRFPEQFPYAAPRDVASTDEELAKELLRVNDALRDCGC